MLTTGTKSPKNTLARPDSGVVLSLIILVLLGGIGTGALFQVM